MATSLNRIDLVDHLLAVDDLAKDSVNAIEVGWRRIWRDDEELRTTGVGVGGFCHREHVRLVLQTVVCFIANGPRGLGARGLRGGCCTVAVPVPYGSVAASSVAVGEVATLEHEARDDSVVCCGVIGTVPYEFLEVLYMRWGVVAVQFDGDFTSFERPICIGPGHLKHDVLAICSRRTEDRNSSKNQQHCSTEGKHASNGWGSVSHQRRECCFADACILHFVSKVVVQCVGTLIV